MLVVVELTSRFCLSLVEWFYTYIFIMILRISDVRCLLAYSIIYGYIGGRGAIVRGMSC